jgi:cyclopropane-fatty-acyl-phospholipid synthase
MPVRRLYYRWTRVKLTPMHAHSRTLSGSESRTGRNHSRDTIEALLTLSGIQINGPCPWDIQVHREELYSRVLAEGSLGLGESYMDGWWDCAALDQFFDRIFRANLERRVRPWREIFAILQARMLNLQRRSKAFEVAEHHYDRGNDLYEAMLDKHLIYSCGYWTNATNLDQAQEAKIDLIARKLDLTPGMRVLDIGCGWGGTAKLLAERTGVEVTGITVSKEQARFARDFCRDLPVDIQLMDYRDLAGSYDRVLSLGMFEHVGYKNYRTFMEVVSRVLKPDGLLLLHTIGSNTSAKRTDPWLHRYIFPNSMLPSPGKIASAIESIFVLEDWHSFGPDYDRTLLAWFKNFDAHWNSLNAKYGARFYRMWKFYLLSCAGGFRARKHQLWQLVLSPTGISGGYASSR